MARWQKIPDTIDLLPSEEKILRLTQTRACLHGIIVSRRREADAKATQLAAAGDVLLSVAAPGCRSDGNLTASLSGFAAASGSGARRRVIGGRRRGGSGGAGAVGGRHQPKRRRHEHGGPRPSETDGFVSYDDARTVAGISRLCSGMVGSRRKERQPVAAHPRSDWDGIPSATVHHSRGLSVDVSRQRDPLRFCGPTDMRIACCIVAAASKLLQPPVVALLTS